MREYVTVKRVFAAACWAASLGLAVWCLTWFRPDWEIVNRYLSVKIPAALTGVFFLFAAASIFNAVTMGRNYGGIKSDPLASAVFFGSLFVALALVISWA
jgi:hypothetical protein